MKDYICARCGFSSDKESDFGLHVYDSRLYLCNNCMKVKS